jgi:uncharacterized protein (TIGR00297 family)
VTPRSTWFVGASFATVVAALAYWRRALTLDGAIAAAVVGVIVFVRGGRAGVAALLAFFISSSWLSRVGELRERLLPLAQAKGAQRDAWQVMANGAIAAMCLGLERPGGFVGALAAAGADTWATELGLVAGRQPRLITTCQPVPRGTSGGITPEGLAASSAGALVVGAAYALLAGQPRAIWLAALAGTSGSLMDSLLGATLQAKYRCRQCGATIEQSVHPPCGVSADLESGLAWITNDTVNLLCTLVGATIGALSWTPNAAGHVRGGS